MLVGSLMRKIKSRSWKKQRYFKLQEDCMTIWYKSKKAGNSHSTCTNTSPFKIGHWTQALFAKVSLFWLLLFLRYYVEFLMLFPPPASFREWRGGNSRGPPVWGPAKHRWWVPSWSMFHPGLPQPQREPGPRGWVSWGSTVLDQRHQEAGGESGEHGGAGETRPVSFTTAAFMD